VWFNSTLAPAARKKHPSIKKGAKSAQGIGYRRNKFLGYNIGEKIW
jgi:hypothetical protein